MEYRGHVFFKPVQSSMIYEALKYLRTHNMFYEDIAISLGLTSNDILDYSKIYATRRNSVTSEVENVEEAEDPGNLYLKGTNETSLMSDLSHVVD